MHTPVKTKYAYADISRLAFCRLFADSTREEASLIQANLVCTQANQPKEVNFPRSRFLAVGLPVNLKNNARLKGHCSLDIKAMIQADILFIIGPVQIYLKVYLTGIGYSVLTL